MGLAESIFGTPGSTNYIRSGGSQASPGYGMAKDFYSWLPSLMQQAYPTYQGSLDPGLSPTLQDAIRRAQGYSQSSPSEVLQGVQGTLGGFMNSSFLNPWNAMMGGNPNYGGANPMQRIYGGQPAGSYGGFAGGNPGMGTPPGVQPLGGSSAMPYGGGQGFAAGEPTPGGGRYGPQQPRPGVPPLGGGGGMWGAQSPDYAGGASAGQPPGGFQGALGMNFNDAQGALARQFQGNPSGLNSALAGQYGMNEFGHQNDGRQQFMHSTDHQSALQRILGREPTFDEVQQSLRSGPGAIEQARGLFMQDYNGSGDWGSGQKSYADLVSQHGLAKGSQMFEQQYGNGPMWAGGAPGSAPSQVPPLGGPPSGPIMSPSTPAMTAPTPPDPMNGGGIASATRPGASPSTPATNIPPLGASGGGGAPTAMPSSPTLSAPRTPRPSTPLGGGIPPLGSGGPVDVGVAKPVGGGGGRPGGVVNVRPNRPGSTDQVPKPRPATPSPATTQPGGPKFIAAEEPKPVFNPKTGNWHTPGAGERRQARQFVRSGGKYVY